MICAPIFFPFSLSTLFHRGTDPYLFSLLIVAMRFRGSGNRIIFFSITGNRWSLVTDGVLSNSKVWKNSELDASTTATSHLYRHLSHANFNQGQKYYFFLFLFLFWCKVRPANLKELARNYFKYHLNVSKLWSYYLKILYVTTYLLDTHDLLP